jgi:hypothetical protein
MTRRIDEFLPDLVGELDCREEVAYTETKAHCDVNTAWLPLHVNVQEE